MADSFGIFREDSVPVMQGLSKEVTLFSKVKSREFNLKKKALGDVSNTVSQKATNTKTNEAGGKLMAESSSCFQQELAAICKPIVAVKETLEESPEVFDNCKFCLDVLESDYDIISKSEKLSDEAIDILCSGIPIASPCSKIDDEMPDLSFPDCMEEVLYDDMYDSDLSDVPIYDLSF